MADVTNTNEAPTRDFVRGNFAPIYVFLCTAASAVAIITGLVLGLVLVND